MRVAPLLLRSAVASVLALALGGHPVRAQGAEQVVASVSTALAAGDVSGLVEHLAARVHLELDGEVHGGVLPRQVRAALNDFLDGWDGSRPEAGRTGGDPDAGSAFTELRWRPRASETGDLVDFVVFVGLAETGDRWRVDELRILRRG